MGDLIIDCQIQQAVKEEVDKKTKELQKEIIKLQNDILNLQRIIKKCLCEKCYEMLTCEERPR